MVVSVRDSLGVAGQSASIKQLAHQRDASFPLSLRQLVGAPPPGRVFRKVIALELLQRKFNEFFNDRERPLFKVRLHNLSTGDHRHSTLDVLFDDPVKGYTSQMKDGQPKNLGQLSAAADYYFIDLNSDCLTLNIIPGQPVGIEAMIHFETEGLEIAVNNFRNIDFTKFYITIRFNLEFDSDNRLVDLRTEREFIKPLISSNWHSDSVEESMGDKIADALKEQETRDKLNRLVIKH
jgi:hypothetical protein